MSETRHYIETYVLLQLEKHSKKKTSSVYDCTVEDVEYIYNTLRLYFCCWMCILSMLLLFFYYV